MGNMKRRYRLSVVMIVFIGISLSLPLSSSMVDDHPPVEKESDGWHYLPAFPDYAPQGLPDFDQRQDNWRCNEGIWRFVGGVWCFCGPTSLSDIFWWFDSKHETGTGHPGDGNDSYPLVRNFKAPGSPNPGPFTDDHNFNNVNDILTSWNQGRGGKELVERLAWDCNTNLCRTLIPGVAGTSAANLEKGANRWIQQAGLEDDYHVVAIVKPDYATIRDAVLHNDGVIVNLLFHSAKMYTPPHLFCHYVAVAGINPDEGYIAFSDPVQNKDNPGPDPAAHNDANVVSHDIYKTFLTSPEPDAASWMVEDFYPFFGIHFDGLVKFALIISENDH
jgi:hypothetical protein